MAHLTWPVSISGPIVELFVTISTSRAKVLRKCGLSVPQGITIPALLDTGASSTVIDESSIKPLGLTPRSVGNPLSTIGTTDGRNGADDKDTRIQCSEYDVFLAISDVKGFVVGDIGVLTTNLSRLSVDALIGRDVLEHCKLVYDGKSRKVTLEY